MDSTNFAGNQRKSIRSEWNEAFARELDPEEGIPAAISRRDALSNWEKIRSVPASLIEAELQYALYAATADYDDPLTVRYLERAVSVYRAGEGDPRWGTLWAATYNVEHGRFTSCGELAAAWLEDRTPNISRLRTAAVNLLAGSRAERPVWSEMAQSEYLHGIELLLIIGDIATAIDKLKVRVRFASTSRYHSCLLHISQLLADSDHTRVEAIFDPYFDRIRSPFFYQRADRRDENIADVEQLRLRLALLRWIYIERQPIAGNWRRIIEQIGY